MENYDLFTSYDVKHIVALVLAAHKQAKEAIHLSLKIRENSEVVPYQFLIFFRINGDPSVFFAKGLYLDDGVLFNKISHRDPKWMLTIENICTSLSGWDSRKGSMLAMITNIASKSIIARPGDIGEFYFKKGNLYPV